MISCALNLHGGTIAQHFRRRSLPSDLGALVLDADDGVRPQVARMLEQQSERVLARLLAHLGVGADLASHNLFEAAEDALADRRRAHDDAAHDALVLGDAVPLDRHGGRGQYRVWHSISSSELVDYGVRGTI